MIKNKLFLIVAFGLILRLLAAGFLYHTDIKSLYRDAEMINDGVAVGYEKAAQAKSPLFYPPAVYVFFDKYQSGFSFLFSDYFNTWMDDWGSLHTANHPRIFYDLLAMKLPLIVFDVLLGLILIGLTKKREMMAGLWFLNPAVIYAIYAFGQYDVIAVFALVLTIFMVEKKRFWSMAYILLGLAAALKQIPLLLLPFVFVIDSRTLVKKMIGIVGFAVVYLILLLPIINSRVGLESVFLYNLNRGMFAAGFDLGSGAFLSVFAVFYFLLLFGIYFNYLKLSFNEVVVILLGGLFAFSLFNPQWIIWLVPSLLLLLIKGKVDWRAAFWWGVFYFACVLLIDDKFVSWGLLKGINNAFDWMPSLADLMAKTFVLDKMIIMARAGFVAIFGIVAWGVINNKKILEIGGRVDLGKVTVLWVVSLTVAFLGSHILLAETGYYVDSERVGERDTINLTKQTEIGQRFEVINNGLAALEIRVKNVSLKSTADVYFQIWDDGKQLLLRESVINGKAIGDDYDLIVDFAPITDSAGKNYWLVIAGEGILVNIDDEEAGGGLMLDGELRDGRLSYRVLYNPGGWKENLGYSLKNIAKKLW